MHALPIGPVDQEGRVAPFIRSTPKFDRLVPDDGHSVSSRLVPEKQLQIWRNLDHGQFGERQPLIDEGIVSVRQVGFHAELLALCRNAVN